MKAEKAILIAILLLFLLSLPSFAQEATTPASQREAVRQKVQERRETLADRIKVKREEASKAAMAKRQAFNTKLTAIRDAKKKAIVERVQTRIDQINQKRTEQMGEFLERLEKMVAKIETRIAKAKMKGLDVSTAEAALVEAKAKSDLAKAAVEAQAGKSYVITITNEAGLKNAVGSVMSSLQKDLRETRKIVTEAKQVAQKVMSLIKGVKGVDDD